jgi:Phosphotransferase enzyme family
VGLDATGAELIRFVNNAVFRLARHPVVVRIVLTPGLRQRADNAANAARLLADYGVPSVELLPDVTQPLHIGTHTATFWQEVPDTGEEPTIADLAVLLRQMHGIPVEDATLPHWNPIDDLRRRINDAEGWDPDDVEFLFRRCDEVEARLAEVRYELPPGVVHGDAHLGNLITTPGGTVLCDFDTTCVGPREWDLVPIAVGYLRFHNTVNKHQQLAEAYGFDVTQWDGFAVLREVRELKLTAAVLPIARSNPNIRSELRRRLRAVRAGDTFSRWVPYR